MASHGDAETAAADKVFEPRVKFAGKSCWDFFYFCKIPTPKRQKTQQRAWNRWVDNIK